MVSINGRDQVLLIDSIDRSQEATSWSFGPGSRQTFADMRNAIPKRLDMTITQDMATGSLFRLALAGGDGTQVTGVYKPLGNEVASATQPHYSFNVTPASPTGDAYIGGDAAEDGSQNLTVEVQWLITDWTEVVA